MVGAASDTLANVMGPDNGCCGSDSASGACGNCLLIQNPDAVNPSWTAVVMKKNRCPPESNGCEAGNAHLDLAVPGYDNLQHSTANVCTGSANQKSGVGLTQIQSSVAGTWYDSCANTTACASLCNSLPSSFQPGCQLFSSWGWTSGNPSNV